MKRNFRQEFSRAVLLMVLVLVTKQSAAQTNSSYSQIIPPSPTTVQFQRYGDYPVSYFNGLPDITIPIYTIQEGDITVPITLSYHASGTRVDDVSGFVGLGWTLNTGGMISRTINGLPDETGIFQTFPLKAAGIGLPGGGSFNDFPDMENGNIDYEYDLYSYNFLGKSGKFVYPPNTPGHPFVFQQKDNLLVQDWTKITDENGIVYGFGGPGNTEDQDYQDRFVTRSAITTWHLNWIVSAKHPESEVYYSYQDGPSYVNYWRWDDHYILDDCWETSSYDPSNYQYSNANAGSGIISTSYLTKSYPKVVKEIDFSNGRIVFNQNDTTKMISSVDIYNNSNILIKKVVLNIAPFPTTHPLDVFSNYKLKSVSFNDILNHKTENYTFNYNEEDVTDAKPRAFDASAGKDYWGFYNGDDGRTSSISWVPYFQTMYYNSGGRFTMTMPFARSAIKTPSEYSTKVYTLNKITYPTGGYTTFDYELNQFQDNQYVPVTPMGGLRVKTISNYSGNGQLATQRNFSYLSAYAEIVPDYSMYMTTMIGLLDGAPFRRTTITQNSSLDFSPQGSAVVYPSVTETDGNTSSNYTYDYGNAFTYQNLDQGQFTGDIFTDFPDTVHWKKITNYYRPWNFGNLLSKTIYGSHFNQSEVNEYEEIVTDTVRDFLMNRWLFSTCPVGNVNNGCNLPPNSDMLMAAAGKVVWKYADHYYLSGGKRLKKTTTTYSVNDRQMITEKDYDYDNPGRPFIANRITTSNSKGETIRTNLKFPYDYPNTHPYDDMVGVNLISPVIEQTETNVTLNKELSRSVTNYDYFNDITYSPGMYSSGNPGYVEPKTIQKSILGNALETDVTINSYDAGNVQQITDKSGIVTTYLYGYDDQYPVAKIVGKDYNTVSQSVNQSVLDNPASDAAILAQLNNLRTSFPDAQVSTYTYKPLVGMTSATDPKGQTTYYEYDNFQRLVNIKDQDGNILKHTDYHYQGQ